MGGLHGDPASKKETGRGNVRRHKRTSPYRYKVIDPSASTRAVAPDVEAFPPPDAGDTNAS